jgi:hypothetical protein
MSPGAMTTPPVESRIASHVSPGMIALFMAMHCKRPESSTDSYGQVCKPQPILPFLCQYRKSCRHAYCHTMQAPCRVA